MRLTDAYAVLMDNKIVYVRWDLHEAEADIEEIQKRHKDYNVHIERISVEDPAGYIVRLARKAGLSPELPIEPVSSVAVAVRALQQLGELLPFIELVRSYLNSDSLVIYKLSTDRNTYHCNTLKQMLAQTKHIMKKFKKVEF